MANKIILCILFVVAIFACLHGQSTSDWQRHHVLVLIDRSQSMRNSLCNDNNLSTLILTDLKSVLFKSGSIIPDRKLLETSDYLSVLSFGLDADAQDFSQFIPNDFGIRMEASFEKNENQVLQQITKQIEGTGGCGSFFNKSYGAYSVAVPTALNLFKEDHRLVNRTFIIIITDGQFNATGQQPHLELETIQDHIKHLKNLNIDIEKPLSVSSNLFESYSLIQGTLEQYEKTNPKQYRINKGNAYMQLHELVPRQRQLAIEAFLRTDRDTLQFYQSSFWERNICQADLNLSYNVSENRNRFYRIDSMYASLTLRDEVIWQTSQSNIDGDIPMCIKIPSNLLDSTLRFGLKYWIRFTDNAYGLHILSPDGHELQGAEGLKRTIPIDPVIKQDKTLFYYFIILGIVLFFSIFLYVRTKKHLVKG